ncbi:DUF4870 domain-containing protein [Dermacoccaceae bacterium W4C1]
MSYSAPPPQEPYPYAQGQPTMLAGDEKGMAAVAHLSAPIAFLFSAGLLSFAGPLVVWFIYKDRSPGVRQAAAGAFNFNLSTWAMTILGWILLFTVVGIPVALVIWAVVFVVAAICHIIGAVKASAGEVYSYPFQIKILN